MFKMVISENWARGVERTTKRIAKAFGHEDFDAPQYVDSMPRPGDVLIAQGWRANVLSEILQSPDAADLPARGYHITADISELDRDRMVRKLASGHAKWKRRHKNGDNGDTGADDLSITLLKARANLGNLFTRSLPVSR